MGHHRLFLLALCALGPPLAQAAELVVVMDDLGYSTAQAERVLALPEPVTLALLPFAPHSRQIAERARATGHEVIVHQPMEPLQIGHARAAVGTLTLDMPPERFAANVEAALGALPGIVGLNNHAGSRLTQDVPTMRRLMSYLADRDLVFLDSRTTPLTVAYDMAREARVPALRRDVFLDHVPTHGAIATEFARALDIARRQGHAVIIAHPHEVTLQFLAGTLSNLDPGLTMTTLRTLAAPDRPAVLARQQSPASPHKSPGR